VSPAAAAFRRLYQSSRSTVLNVVWPPKMTIMPHNHTMWAVIGVYTGREDNIFWRRLEGGDAGELRRRRKGPVGEGHGAAWPGHHSFGDQPDSATDRRDPRLRR